ncbi:MAG: 6,7-dimethyl-8-ribityllumazine synthase [Betaproteobacteria bacterium]|nr:6,7-dimethyl-8-ribityllumazine synthase [Betaproteobacteria bacterium]
MAIDDDIDRIDIDPSGEGLTVGVVCSRFNAPVCDALLEACVGELLRLGVRRDDITVVRVPGALEIPMALSGLARTEQFHALVALGAVIRGETYHFEVVSDQSASGIMRVQLDTGIPVANGVLTTNTDEQAEARMHVKGAEAGRAAIEMANLLQAIEDERD